MAKNPGKAAEVDPYIGKDLLDGQFQILQKIGAGGMGAVYKALQPSMNRSVAVKILHPKLTNRKDIVARFRREARAMSHLTHPNTVKVLLYGELEDGGLYIVMEYLEGKNLNQVVRKEGPMPAERAIPVLVQVCGALQEAHTQGIIHRDLKPENIFLSTNGGLRDFPKVLDFGLAKVTEREMRPGSIMLTQEGMVFGTPEFMSPEQAQGKPLDSRSDIYALAVILYEVLTGKLPYEAKTAMEYIQLHVSKPPIPLSQRVPGRTFAPGLEAVVMRALGKRPEDRWSSAAEFAEALKPYSTTSKGYTGMMPAQAIADMRARAPEAAAQAYGYAQGTPGAPAAAISAPVPVAYTPPPGSVDPLRPIMPSRTVKMAQAEYLMPPPSRVAPSSRTAPPPVAVWSSPGYLVGIALVCLSAGILVTLLILYLVR